MTFGNPQSPGTPQPGSPAAPAPDYRYGQVSDTVRQARRAADMKAQWAPWPLKIAAVLEVFITSYTVYNICRLIAFENSPAAVTRTDQLSTELGVCLLYTSPSPRDS